MIKTIIKENLYLDSVFSMTAGRELKKLEGIKSATLVMGTDLNKSVLAEIGALTPEAQAATSNTLIIALETEKEGIEAEAEALLEKLLAGSTEKSPEKNPGSTNQWMLPLMRFRMQIWSSFRLPVNLLVRKPARH